VRAKPRDYADNFDYGNLLVIDEGGLVARKTILVCDNCGKEVAEGRGATMRVTFTDARRGAKAADLCDPCAGGLPGKAVARRGRRPKAREVAAA
jgi:hypothetical protein